MALRLGYQVYSARDAAEIDLLSVLRSIQEMGYDGVEFAGFYGLSAEQVRQMLEETGLVAVSSHVPFDLILGDPQGTIDFHKQIGCGYIAVPFLPPELAPGGPAFALTIRRIAAFGALCREHGITLLYHNHDFEFVKVSGQYGLDFLYDAVDPEDLQTELDTCWVRVAGENPAAYVAKYAGRCPVVHLKDYVGAKRDGEVLYDLIGQEPGADAEVAFDFRPVGYGVQDIPSIVRSGLASGTQWFIVEQDRSTERPALEAAKMSCDYLRGLDL